MVSAAAVALPGCGGGADAAFGEQPQARAERAVAPSELPRLHRCLASVAQALARDPAQRFLGLDCLTGTYPGLTASGEACQLRADGGSGEFVFSIGQRQIALNWGTLAYRPGDTPLHNLQVASAGAAEPGVQLVRFSPLPEAVTETLTLRAGPPDAGARSLPTLSYLRVAADATTEVRCRFGA